MDSLIRVSALSTRVSANTTSSATSTGGNLPADAPPAGRLKEVPLLAQTGPQGKNPLSSSFLTHTCTSPRHTRALETFHTVARMNSAHHDMQELSLFAKLSPLFSYMHNKSSPQEHSTAQQLKFAPAPLLHPANIHSFLLFEPRSPTADSFRESQGSPSVTPLQVLASSSAHTAAAHRPPC